jgi:hypothetical protein
MRKVLFLLVLIFNMNEAFCTPSHGNDTFEKSFMTVNSGIQNERVTIKNESASYFEEGSLEITVTTNATNKFVISSGSLSSLYKLNYIGNGVWKGLNVKGILPLSLGTLNMQAMDGSDIKIMKASQKIVGGHFSISMMPCPTPTIVGSLNGCRNATLNFEVDSFTALNTYLWTVTGGATISDAIDGRVKVNIPSNPTGPVSVTLIETDATNCVGTSTVTLSIENTEALVCDNEVIISLGDDCRSTVTADILLEGQTYANSSYSIVIRDAAGNIVPANLASNPTFLNKNLIATVTHICSGLSCWGNIKFEDKIAPTITCPANDTVSCFSTATFNLPSAKDNCGTSASVREISNILLENACGSDVAAVRTIVYRATDAVGNVSLDCTRKIAYRYENIDSVVVPKNYDGLPGSNPTLSCENLPRWDLNSNYYPEIAETGSPTLKGNRLLTNNGICKINMTFSDDTVKICNRSYKLVRTFTILDWCSGKVVTKTQIIKVLDNKGPIVTSSPDFGPLNVTRPYDCKSDVKLPKPNVIFDCSTWDYTVQYLLADVNGAPPINGLYIVTDVVRNADSTYTIKNLPKGLTWIKYIIRDECGNTTESFTEVYVRDAIPPVAICQQFTVASVTNNGQAQIKAESLNDGSYDNCGKVSFEIARMNPGCNQGTEFGPAAVFCCEEIGTEQMAQFRVWDDANSNGIFGDVIDIYNDNSGNGIFGDANDRLVGRISDNSNICMVRVKVQDKTNPVIVCPPNISIDCQAQTDTLYTGGGARAVDNCQGVSVSLNPSRNISSCSVGTITNTFTATDKSGNTATCRQVVTVEDKTPFNVNNINWGAVANRDLTSCSKPNFLSPEFQGRPTWTNAECTLIGAEYKDQVFNLVEDVCVKILRKWTVIDWCAFNLDNTKGKYEYIQVIKITNSTAPKLASCPVNPVACIEGENCNGLVTLNHPASDDCTPDSLLSYIYTIDKKDDGTIETSGGTANFSGTLTPDVYRVKVTVKDICGNEDFCSYKLTVRDCKKPTPYCYSDLVTVVMNSPSKNVSIWARDFDKGSTDNCGGPLRFAFSTNVLDTQKVFTCSDRGIQKVKMYAIDQSGNSDFCEVRINIQSTGDVCGPGSTVEGRIQYSNKNPMGNVTLNYVENGSAENIFVKSDKDGKFEINSNKDPQTISLSAIYDEEVMKGISTLDLVFIQRHILGLAKFDTPQKFIAADVNKSSTISVADLVSLRKLILGVDSKFSNNNSFVFIPSDYQFTDNAYSYPNGYNENYVIGKSYNFTGIKIGDVNNSSLTELNGEAEPRSSRKLAVYLGNATTDEDGKTSIPVIAGNDFNLSGLQTTLKWVKSSIESATIVGNTLKLDQEHYSSYNLKNGLLPISFTSTKDVNIQEGDVLFTIKVNASTEVASALSLSNEMLTSEVYNENMEVSKFELQNRNNKKNEEFFVSQNAPNPFNNTSNVTVKLGKDSELKWKVTDITGKVIYQNKGYFNAGTHTINLNVADIKTSGLLNYTIESTFGTITKKMIITN